MKMFRFGLLFAAAFIAALVIGFASTAPSGRLKS